MTLGLERHRILLAPINRARVSGGGGFFVPLLRLEWVRRHGGSALIAARIEIHAVGVAGLGAALEILQRFVRVLWYSIAIHVEHAQVADRLTESEVGGLGEEAERLGELALHAEALVVASAEPVHG